MKAMDHGLPEGRRHRTTTPLQPPGRFRFLSICGYACEFFSIPPVHQVTVSRHLYPNEPLTRPRARFRLPPMRRMACSRPRVELAPRCRAESGKPDEPMATGVGPAFH